MGKQVTSGRFVYRTSGVCPPEIHFELENRVLKKLRLVGGGCPGNAKLLSRLLEGQPLESVLPLLEGISCRNGTSCPDQLATALETAQSGHLPPAKSFRLAVDPYPKRRIGLIGELHGDPAALELLLRSIHQEGVAAIYCLGNHTGGGPGQETLLKMLRGKEMTVLQGKRDWHYAEGTESGKLAPLQQRDRDWLLRLPQVLSFRMGEVSGVAFYGRFIQQLPGFSDYEPFALEINMVCDLTDFMNDETVFPALEAMTPQFTANIVVFGQSQRWGHWHVGGRHFVRVGASAGYDQPRWGLLELHKNHCRFEVMAALR
jgi:uncharacterized protein (TIGR03905 family)